MAVTGKVTNNRKMNVGIPVPTQRKHRAKSSSCLPDPCRLWHPLGPIAGVPEDHRQICSEPYRNEQDTHIPFNTIATSSAPSSSSYDNSCLQYFASSTATVQHQKLTARPFSFKYPSSPALPFISCHFGRVRTVRAVNPRKVSRGSTWRGLCARGT